MPEPSTSTVLFPPQAAQLAVGLQRRRAAAPLETRLPVLDEPGQERRERDAADDLGGARNDRRAAHPISPDARRRGARGTRPAIRYAT